MVPSWGVVKEDDLDGYGGRPVGWLGGMGSVLLSLPEEEVGGRAGPLKAGLGGRQPASGRAQHLLTSIVWCDDFAALVGRP